jgi:hypothetical protein
LAESATFKEARKQIEDRPGVFAYATPAPLLSTLEKQLPLRGHEREFLAMMHKVVNPKAARAVAVGWSLDQGNLAYRKLALLDPKEHCPLFELLPSKAVDTSMLHFAPKDTVLAAALNNADGEKRWDKLIALADAVVPGGRAEEKPSAFMKQFEGMLGVQIGKDVMGQISNAAFVMGDPMNAPIRRIEEKGPNFRSVHMGPELPMLVILQAVGTKVAANLEKVVPKALFGGNGKVGMETIEGREVHSVKLGHDTVYYGRHENTLVFGPYGTPVARSLTAGAKQQGLLASPQAAARLKEMHERQAIFMVKPVQIIVSAATVMVYSGSFSSEAAPAELPKEAQPKRKQGFRQEAQPPARADNKRDVKVTVQQRSKEEQAMLRELSKIFEHEDWFVVGLERTKDRIQLDGHVGGLREVVPRVVDFAIEQIYKHAGGRHAPEAETAPSRPPERK